MQVCRQRKWVRHTWAPLLCVRDLWIGWGLFYLNQQVLALKFPVFLQMGPFRDLPPAAVPSRARAVWHTWEAEQAPAFFCGLSWPRLRPVLYSVSKWLSIQDLAHQGQPWSSQTPICRWQLWQKMCRSIAPSAKFPKFLLNFLGLRR